MALEVQSQSYLFNKMASNKEFTNWAEYKNKIQDNFSEIKVESDDSADGRFVLHHNVLHNLESLFWIALWFLLFCVPKDTKEPLSDDKNKN